MYIQEKFLQLRPTTNPKGGETVKFVSQNNKADNAEYTNAPDPDMEIPKPLNIPSYRDTANHAKNKKKKT